MTLVNWTLMSPWPICIFTLPGQLPNILYVYNVRVIVSSLPDCATISRGPQWFQKESTVAWNSLQQKNSFQSRSHKRAADYLSTYPNRIGSRRHERRGGGLGVNEPLWSGPGKWHRGDLWRKLLHVKEITQGSSSCMYIFDVGLPQKCRSTGNSFFSGNNH